MASCPLPVCPTSIARRLLHSNGEKPELSAPAPRSYPDRKKPPLSSPTSSVVGLWDSQLRGLCSQSQSLFGPPRTLSLHPVSHASIISQTKKRTPFSSTLAASPCSPHRPPILQPAPAINLLSSWQALSPTDQVKHHSLVPIIRFPSRPPATVPTRTRHVVRRRRLQNVRTLE